MALFKKIEFLMSSGRVGGGGGGEAGGVIINIKINHVELPKFLPLGTRISNVQAFF